MESRLLLKMGRAGGMAILAITIFLAGYLTGSIVGATPIARAQTDTDELFRPFWQVWDLVHQRFVGPIDDTAMMEGAIRGMLETLGDPYTSYMTPDEFQMAQEDLEGDFEGIGAVVRQDEETGALMIISVLEGSPAEAAGIMPGDAVYEVDGEDITALSQNEIVGRIRGPAGTPVTLGIRRRGMPGMIEITVIRARIEVPNVTGEMIGDIAYIRLSSFGESAVGELRQALEDLMAQSPVGLVLDMRCNPGGYLGTAINVADEFMDGGIVLIERGGAGEQTYRAGSGGLATEIPIVILVDGGSASASELVAGALRDNGRAVLVGSTTFGKGSVQTWYPLENGGGVRITISRWYTPNGSSVQDVGLTPDVEIMWPSGMIIGDFDPELETALRLLHNEEIWFTWPLPPVIYDTVTVGW